MKNENPLAPWISCPAGSGSDVHASHPGLPVGLAEPPKVRVIYELKV
jgi:hypothetical protein